MEIGNRCDDGNQKEMGQQKSEKDEIMEIRNIWGQWKSETDEIMEIRNRRDNGNQKQMR